MGRRHCFRGFVVSLVFCVCSGAVAARPKSSPTYDGAVGFGAQLLHLDGGCLSVEGSITSGNFFDDLKRADVHGQLEYSKRGKEVSEYPRSVTTSVRIVGDSCSGTMSSSPSSIFRGNSYSVRFVVEWKNGMQLRPAALAPIPARCVGYSSATVPGGEATIPSITCQMTVNSEGIPLADHLIVSIFTADGRPITRISAAP